MFLTMNVNLLVTILLQISYAGWDAHVLGWSGRDSPAITRHHNSTSNLGPTRPAPLFSFQRACRQWRHSGKPPPPATPASSAVTPARPLGSTQAFGDHADGNLSGHLACSVLPYKMLFPYYQNV